MPLGGHGTLRVSAGFGIDHMNTVVEVDPSGPVANKLQVTLVPPPCPIAVGPIVSAPTQVGDKIVAVDGEMLNFRKFVEVRPQFHNCNS